MKLRRQESAASHHTVLRHVVRGGAEPPAPRWVRDKNPEPEVVRGRTEGRAPTLPTDRVSGLLVHRVINLDNPLDVI